MTATLFLLAAADAGGTAATAEFRVLPMILLGLIMTATYVLIAFEWLHKSLAAMLGAIVAVAAALSMGLFEHPGEPGTPYTHAVHDIIGHDLAVIGVLVGTSVLVEIAGRSGLFHFLAVKIVKQTHGDPVRLLLFIAVATVLFVTFLTIAPGTLIMVSLALVVTKELEVDPKPYLMTIALCANSGALVTFASGICTLMLGTAGRLPYVHFFIVSTPMAFISAAVAYGYLRWFYSTSLVAPGTAEERAAKVAAFDEWALVMDRRQFYRSAGILGATIVGFALAKTVGVGVDFIAICGGTAALLLSGISPDEAIRKVNWTIILFFVGLFVIVGAVQESGLLTWQATKMVSLARGDTTTAMLMIAAFVLVMSGLVDNIPVAATLIPIVRTMEDQGIAGEPLWWALVLASNLGGNSTPVGSISSVIAMHALEKERGIKVSWGEFLRVGGVITLLQGVLVLAYLYFFQVFHLFPARP